jgi:protein N-terminal methyltransferase
LLLTSRILDPASGLQVAIWGRSVDQLVWFLILVHNILLLVNFEPFCLMAVNCKNIFYWRPRAFIGIEKNTMENNEDNNRQSGDTTDTKSPQTSVIRLDEVSGTDSEGNKYSSIEEMWNAQGVSSISRETTKAVWYDRAAEYYESNCEPTLDGVLGGFASISDTDLKGSRQFLDDLRLLLPSLDFSLGSACECGAGIGRVTKGLLLGLGVSQCDIVESSSRLLYEAPEYIGEGASKCRFYCSGLQDWDPPKRRYSIIWIQWVLCYLTDNDIIAFLKRCSEGILEDGKGVIILKENTCGDQTFVVDSEDASVCRSLPYWLKLVEAAGLRVLMQKMQSDFPTDIFPVPMLALGPGKS